MNQYPGDVADQIGGGLLNGVEGLVSGVANAIGSAGEAVQRGLDKPADALNLKHSPFRVIDDVLDGTVESTEQSINNGIFRPLGHFFDKVTDGLDKIPDTFAGRGNGPNFRPPWEKR